MSLFRHFLSISPPERSSTIAKFSPDNRYLARLETEVRRMGRQVIFNDFAKFIQWTPESEMIVLCEGLGLGDQMTFWDFDMFLNHVPQISIVTPSGGLCRADFGEQDSVIIPADTKGILKWSMGASRLVRIYGAGYGWGYDWLWHVAKFGPDDSIILGINYAGEVTAWNSITGEALISFSPSPWGIGQIFFIHDGKIMVLPAEDGTIRLWGVSTEK